MACTSKMKREISYFGPIYINNHNSHGTKVDRGTSSEENDNTVYYRPIDVTKYKIKTQACGNKQPTTAPSPTGWKPPSMQACSHEAEFQITTHQKHEQESDRIAERVTLGPVTLRRRLRIPKHSRSHSTDNGDRNCPDDYEQFDNIAKVKHVTESMYTFKISSTEDNYVFDKFKAKSKMINTTMDDKTCDYEGADISCIETPNDGLATKAILVSPSDEPRNHKDFLARHRSRISRLKRKFFESNTVPKPIPVENIKHVEDVNVKQDAGDESPPPKPPRVSMPSQRSATESKASFKKNIKQRQRRHSADETLGRNSFDELRMRWSTTSDQYVVVVAIDFGTTYSGYAYSFNYDPETIHVMRRQDSGDPGVYNQKVPTSLLITPEGNFHSFGYAAGEYYRDLDPKEATDWMYFDRFKMMLHEEKALSRDTVLKTQSGKEFSALKVFAYSLAYFKELVMQEFSDQSGMSITSDVIRWVITVPAIWKASAKQFMRQAANEAGMVTTDLPDQLIIALEPEAASVYCRRLRMFHILSSGDSLLLENTTEMNRSSSQSLPELRSNDVSLVSNNLETGTHYMVVDCGGGTVDITVHELLVNGRLKELQRASGGSHGSVGVDEAFELLLGRIFGTDIILHFKKKRPTGWTELMSVFESRKRTASPYRTSDIAISLPFSFIDFYKKCRGSSVGNAVRLYGDTEVTWTANGMLRLSPGVMRTLFIPTTDRIKQSIGSVLNNRQVTGIEYMFLVGGFAESSIVQHEMRRDFGSLLKIIIPPGVGMTILKGAVCFGQDPHVVTSRCSCYTYGVGVMHRFDPLKHREDKLVSKDGVDWCTDVFDAFVHVDQAVELGETIVRRYTPVRRDQSATTINIYSTDKDNVMYISDPGVSKCGTLNLALADVIPGSHRREIKTEMMFGDTEIRVRALDVTGGESVEASVDFINI